MPERKKRLRFADAARFEACTCGCGLAYFVLVDKKGEAFACAGMKLEEWPTFIRERMEAVVEQRVVH